MGHALLWIESLVLSLLLVALWTTFVARWMSFVGRWGQVFAAGLFALLLLAVHVGVIVLVSHEFYRGVHMPMGLYASLATLTGFFALGAIALLLRGFRRMASTHTAAAMSWPCGRLLALLVAVGCSQAMTLWILDQAAQQKAAGLEIEAWTLALSVAPARPLDRENAASLYQQAFAQLAPWPERKPDLDATGGIPGMPPGSPDYKPPPPTCQEKWTQWHATGKLGFDLDDPELKQFLEKQKTAFELLRVGANKLGCLFDWNYDRPSLHLEMSGLWDLEQCTDRLALDSLFQATHGNRRRAFEDIQAMYFIAEHVRAQMYCAVYSAEPIERQACEALQLILASKSITEADMALLHSLDGPSYRTLIKRDLPMERTLVLDAIRQYTVNNELDLIDGGRLSWRFAPIYRVFLFDADLAAYKRLAAESEHIADGKSYRDMRDRATAFDQRVQIMPGAAVTSAFTVHVTRVIEKSAQADASRRVACLGVALYRYHLKNGRFPEKLDSLAPEFLPIVPNDPFDDKPMKLKRTEQGLIVYSIGPDVTDDGGAAFDETKKTGDITFVCPVPKP